MLGNKLGSSEFSADPMVCICGWVGRPDWPVRVVAAGIVGGKGDCIILSEGFAASNGEGRKTRKGMLRNGVATLGRRMLEIRWKLSKSSGFFLRIR